MRKQTKTNKSLVLALLTGAVAVGFTGGATHLAAADVAPTVALQVLVSYAESNIARASF